MINDAITFLQGQVNHYLQLKLQGDLLPGEDLVYDSIAKPNGEYNIGPDKLGLTIVGVEEEKIHKVQSPYKKTDDGVVIVNPEIKLNCYILFTANYTEYDTGFHRLSLLISFFQGLNVFTPQNFPELNPEIEKIILELKSQTFEEQNHMWGFIGAKYLPSMLYKMRLIVIQDNRILKETFSAEKIQKSLSNT